MTLILPQNYCATNQGLWSPEPELNWTRGTGAELN